MCSGPNTKVVSLYHINQLHDMTNFRDGCLSHCRKSSPKSTRCFMMFSDGIKINDAQKNMYWQTGWMMVLYFFQNQWLGYLLHSTYDPSHLVIPQHARRSQTGWWHFEWWFEGPWMDGSLWPQRVKIPQIWQLEIISSNRGSVMYHTFFHNKTKDVITVDCYVTNFESGLVALGWCLMHSDAKDCTQQNLFSVGGPTLLVFAWGCSDVTEAERPNCHSDTWDPLHTSYIGLVCY